MIRYWKLHREQWLPAEELKRRQGARLRQVVRHAFEHSAFYRRRLQEAGIAPDDIREASDLRHVPVTPREALRDPEQMIASNYPVSRLRRSMTSGSTGRVTTTYFDRRGWLTAKILLKLRARMACGVRPWDRMALLQEGRHPNSAFRGTVLRQRSFSILDSFTDTLDAVRRYSPTAIYGFPSHLMRLGEAASGDIAPKCIFTSGEMLDPDTRRSIETNFHAPVFDVYGSTELKEIAWQCPRREGYHINSDQVIVETEDRSEMLLVTSLYNYGMPLLRYRLGDTGRLIEGECGCGRGLPLMAPCLGRSVDYFILPDGRAVSPYAMTCAVEVVDGMRQYQIVQEASDRVTVNVVPLQGSDPLIGGQLETVLRPLLGGVHLSVRFVDEIARESSGKYRIVVSRVAKR